MSIVGRWWQWSAALSVALALAVAVAGCGSGAGTASGKGQIVAVGAENEYANVIAQIGGRYVRVTAIESNPNTDPHTFRGQPERCRARLRRARLVVQNGLGYDSFMDKIESASPNSSRKVIDVQRLLGLPDSTPNPHLWYEPQTMPAVAAALAADLSAIEPAHAAYFAPTRERFDALAAALVRALQRSRRAIRTRRSRRPSLSATTCCEAAGTDNLTPFRFQADIMNGVDPAPQDVTLESGLFSAHKVKVFALQPAGDRLADPDRSSPGREAQRHPGRRRLRDDADARLRLPVVDARGGGRAAKRRSLTRSRRESCDRAC